MRGCNLTDVYPEDSLCEHVAYIYIIYNTDFIKNKKCKKCHRQIIHNKAGRWVLRFPGGEDLKWSEQYDE